MSRQIAGLSVERSPFFNGWITVTRAGAFRVTRNEAGFGGRDWEIERAPSAGTLSSIGAFTKIEPNGDTGYPTMKAAFEAVAELVQRESNTAALAARYAPKARKPRGVPGKTRMRITLTVDVDLAAYRAEYGEPQLLIQDIRDRLRNDIVAAGQTALAFLDVGIEAAR